MAPKPFLWGQCCEVTCSGGNGKLVLQDGALISKETLCDIRSPGHLIRGTMEQQVFWRLAELVLLRKDIAFELTAPSLHTQQLIAHHGENRGQTVIVQIDI